MNNTDAEALLQWAEQVKDQFPEYARRLRALVEQSRRQAAELARVSEDSLRVRNVKDALQAIIVRIKRDADQHLTSVRDAFLQAGGSREVAEAATLAASGSKPLPFRRATT